LTTLAVAVVGVGWLVRFSDVRPPKTVSVLHRGLVWKMADSLARPYCPAHDVRLLIRPNNDDQEIWELSNPTRLGDGGNECLLWCPLGDGHFLPQSEPWLTSSVMAEARMLIERAEGSRKHPRSPW
jgi:hypothetical protein